MADEPHPQLEPILELVAEAPPIHQFDPETARAQFEQLSVGVEGDPVEAIEDITVPGADGELDARVYRPGESPRPVVVYFHGGGFVIGSIETHDATCRALATEADVTVVSVEYRLAPEHPFPAPLEDAYAATTWIADNPEAVGGDGRLVVAGDSAGGNLAAGVTLLARDHDGPTIDHQLLIYPVVSSGLEEFDSYEENAEGYFLESETMEWFHDQHVQSPVHARNEYRAPLLVTDLAGLPSATVITAGFDPLRDEGNLYAERLAEAGVDVELYEYEAMVHGFIGLLEQVDRAHDAIEDLATGLDGALAS